MSISLISLFPDPEPLLQLSPEEVAWVILDIVKSWDANQLHQNMNHHNFSSSETAQYTRLRPEVMNVLAEGWAWLQRECLFVPKPGNFNNVILSRKAANDLGGGDASQAQDDEKGTNVAMFSSADRS